MREGWTYKKLGEVLIFDKRFNGIPKAEQPKITKFTHVSAEVLKSLQTDNGEVKLLSTGLFSASTTVDLAGDYINEGEVVTIPTGGVANIKYYKGKFVDSGNILGVSNSPHILLKFIYLCMIAKNELINSYFRGASIKHPYMPDIYKIPVPVPPLAEQERIVAELDLISSIIDKKKAQLKEYDQLAQSIFYSMFGDPITNEKGWEVKKMEDLCSNIVDCPHSTPKKVDYVTQYPCIRTSELRGGSVQWETMQYLDEEEYFKRIKRLKPISGDIVFGREGTIGDAVILPEGYNFSLGQRTMLIRVDSSIISNVYMHRVILSEWVKSQIDAVNVSSTVAHVNIKDFKLFNIPLPPLSLQQEFAAKIEAIEKQKSLIQQSIKETETLFNSRMDYYFN